MAKTEPKKERIELQIDIISDTVENGKRIIFYHFVGYIPHINPAGRRLEQPLIADFQTLNVDISATLSLEPLRS